MVVMKLPLASYLGGGRGPSTRDRLWASQTWKMPYDVLALVARPNFAVFASYPTGRRIGSSSLGFLLLYGYLLSH